MPSLHTGQSLGMGLPLVAKEGPLLLGWPCWKPRDSGCSPATRCLSIEEPQWQVRIYIFLIQESLCADFSCWASFLVTS